MSTPIKCPDCGTWNDSKSEACTECNFPLTGVVPTRAPRVAEAPSADIAASPAEPTEAELRRVRPIRTRPPRAPQDPMSNQLWLVIGGIAIALLIYQAFTGFHQSNFKPVAGAKPEQQQRIDAAREALAKDSLDLQARITLADVLYDTANWSEAIVHYRAAMRLDSTRATTAVDLGVCYYNLGDAMTARDLFQKAIAIDPQQPVALFNLGIVAESQHEDREALDYFRRAKAANPPPGMQQPLEEHMQKVSARLGVPPER